MARQEINLGALPTGAGGDTTRSTGVKINSMTQELYAAANLASNSGWGGIQKLIDSFDFNNPPAYSTTLIGQNCLNGPDAGDFYVTVQYLNDLNISMTAQNITSNITYTRTKVGVWRPWRRVTSAGDYGIGLGLRYRNISQSWRPITNDTGVSFEFLNGDVPAGTTDGALLTMAYSDAYAFQMLGDWRTGEIHTNALAPAGETAGRGWVKHYNARNSFVDPAAANGGLMSRTVIGTLAISKFANGVQIINGHLGATPQMAPGAITLHRFEIPFSAGADANFTQVSPNVQPAVSYDHYGGISSYVEGGTSVVVVIRNGVTAAQAFSVRVTITGHWK